MENTNEKKKTHCWTGYHQEGWKMKGGKKVPNCVPNKSKSESLRLHESLIEKLSQLEKHYNEK